MYQKKSTWVGFEGIRGNNFFFPFSQVTRLPHNLKFRGGSGGLKFLLYMIGIGRSGIIFPFNHYPNMGISEFGNHILIPPQDASCLPSKLSPRVKNLPWL